MLMPRPERDVYSVSRLNREVRMLLEAGIPSVWVEGEISNFSAPASGHWYFTLKDRDAQIRCAMFRNRNQGVAQRPRDGQLLQARGRVGLYEPRGEYQMVVELLEDAGEGALRREFEQLKNRLAAEGLFHSERKRPLPRWPRRIGVVTSGTGAALRDILHVLQRRYPVADVLIYPVPVQGTAAAAAIRKAIALASSRGDCQVLIVARGGGSLEDLWSFNDEGVARAIFAAAIPVVTGIGHETDFTIADFVADVRAPTPSAAAQLATPDRLELLPLVRALSARLQLTLQRQLAQARQQLQAASKRLQLSHPGHRLQQQAQHLDELEQRLRRAVRQRLSIDRQRYAALSARLQRAHAGQHISRLQQCQTDLYRRLNVAMGQCLADRRQRLQLALRALDAVSPLAVLGRGYALVSTADGQLLRDTRSIALGDAITVRLAQGQLTATVTALPAEDTPP